MAKKCVINKITKKKKLNKEFLLMKIKWKKHVQKLVMKLKKYLMEIKDKNIKLKQTKIMENLINLK